MPERIISIDMGAAVRRARELGSAAASIEGTEDGGTSVSVRWSDSDGTPIGDSIDLGPVGQQLLEFPDEAGRMSWAREPADVSITLETPDRGHALDVFVDDIAVSRIPAETMMTAASELAPPRRERFGPAFATFAVQVIAERFEVFEPFQAKAKEAYEWALGCAPFDRPQIGAKLAFDLLFWETDEEAGLFDTNDGKSQGGRLFYGDRQRARHLLAPHLNPRNPSVILINSALRGGAGGTPGYSAWASIGSHDWHAVCVHELGHGFGLADEYVDPVRAGEAPHGEPNIAERAIAGMAPWRDRISVPSNCAPSHDLDHQDPSSEGAIGTFAGARYRTDLYRPMRSCIMRSTDVRRFCDVCADVIVRSLA